MLTHASVSSNPEVAVLITTNVQSPTAGHIFTTRFSEGNLVLAPMSLYLAEIHNTIVRAGHWIISSHHSFLGPHVHFIGARHTMQATTAAVINGADGTTFVVDIVYKPTAGKNTNLFLTSYSFELSLLFGPTNLPALSMESAVVGVGVCYAMPSSPIVIVASNIRILVFDANTLTLIRNISFGTFRAINVDPFTCDIVATFFDSGVTSTSITADGSTMSSAVPPTNIIGFSLLKFNNNTKMWSPSWLSYAASSSVQVGATAFDPRSQVLAATLYASDVSIMLSFAGGASQTILNPEAATTVTSDTIMMTIDTPSGNMIAFSVIGGSQYSPSLIFNPITSMFDLALVGAPSVPQWDPALNFIDNSLSFPIYVSHFTSTPPRCAGSFFGPISLSLSVCVCLISHLS